MEGFQELYFIDGGKISITVYQPSLDEQNFDDVNEKGEKVFHSPVEESYSTLSYQEFLDYSFQPNSLIVGENAHFDTRRTERSLSQPFTDSQLLSLYAKLSLAGITLKLFPEQSTPLALDYSNSMKKTDEDDCKSTFLYLRGNPHLLKTLKNPPTSFAKNSIREEGYERKDELNIHLNKARRFEYKDKNDHLTKWIYENIEELAKLLSLEARDAFALIDTCSSGKRKGQFKKIAMAQIYTVLATMMNQDGEFKLRSNDQLVGWEFVRRHLIPMSSFHRRGGVGRSNIFHHGLKNYVARHMDNKVLNDNGRKVVKKRASFSAQEKEAFTFYRNQYCKCVRELFQTIKRMLVGVQSSF